MTKILIADDVEQNRYLLRVLLKGNGYEVAEATNGAEALALAQTSPPDLILSDILMPVMDGFELCRRWKNDEQLRPIPLVFYTATYTEPDDERYALSLGAERFVVKPQAPEALLATVRQVLAAARSGEQTRERERLSDEEALRQHNQVLIRKLEQKVAQLEGEVLERTRIQAAYEESQLRLQEAHRLAHIGIWDWSAETDTVFWSEELYRIAGLDSAGPAPKYAEQPALFTADSWRRLDACVQATLRSGQSYQLELELLRPDSSSRYVTALGSATRNRAGNIVGLHGMLQDITERETAERERRKLEEQLRVSQKMEAIGRLAGGVAHDFNNLLLVILSYVGFAVNALREGDPLRDDMFEIKKAGERAAALTRQLLAFSRKQVLEVQALDLNQIVLGLEKMLRRLIGEDIEFGQVLAPNSVTTLADPGQVEQVIMNLVVNARDAMPRGGRLTVSTANVELETPYTAGYASVPPGRYALLSIGDTGCGMDEAILQRLFEPFFTTKEAGKGTGLGLSIVYGIVKQSGGNVVVLSEPGKGTTFKIYLPRATEEPIAAAASRTLLPQRARTETILVVEDEEAVRKATTRMLQLAGYQVLAASNGGEALLLCESHPGDIDLLLTDVVMPNIGGRDLVQRLAQVRSKLKVLYMSGYTDGAIAQHNGLLPGTGFIRKPFSAPDLERKVRQALDDAPGSTRIRWDSSADWNPR